MDKRLDHYRFDVGTARVEPEDPIVAGAFFTRKVIFTAGTYGVDEGAQILVCKRLSSDMEIPQFEDPAASGYVSVTCSNEDVGLTLSYQEQGYLDDWRSGVAIRIAQGYLCEGDEVVLVLGDTSCGGPGIRAQTFPEARHTFKIVVDTFNRKHFYELERDPEIRVVGGAPETWHLVCSQTPVQDEEFSTIVRGVDSWGNPADEFIGEASIKKSLRNWREGNQVPGKVGFSASDGGVKRLGGARLTGEGPYRMRLEDPTGLVSLSPPILPRTPDDPYSLFWGDIHGQTRSTVGTGTVEEYFRFARDKAGVDIAAWQGNDFRVRKEDWAEVVRGCKAFNEPGRFVTLLGYEWSGTRSGGGDYNIYYAGDEGTIHRSSHAGIDDLSDVKDDRFPISALWETFRGRKDVMSVAHVGGRACNLDFFDAEFVHLAEIHSHHGTFEWFAEEVLARGFCVGFIGGSDDHTGRQGLVYPNRRSNNVVTFDVKGGLMGLYAKELTSEAVWEAMRSRRTYATNGERIYLKTSCGKALMGEEVKVQGPPAIRVEVHGTAPLLDVELRRGAQTIHRHPVSVPTEGGRTRRIRVQWSGVTQKSGRDKKVEWRGGIALDKGAMLSHTPYALDQYDDVVTRVSNKLLRFVTATSGDPDGVLIDLDAPPGRTPFLFQRREEFLTVPRRDNGGANYHRSGRREHPRSGIRSRVDAQGLERALSVHGRRHLFGSRQPLLGVRPASRRGTGLVESNIREV